MKKSITPLLLGLCLLAGCSKVREPADCVDPFIGTGSHGHTYPGATTPYGAVQLSPDTRRGDWDACAGYHYSDSTLLGFSHTHLSGTGCIDLGDILFQPTTKDVKPAADGYLVEPMAFSHKDEHASPGYYSVLLRDEGIGVELTATKYTGVHRYTYRKDSDMALVIDLAHLLAEETIDLADIRRTGPAEITGMRRTQGWTPDQYVFFVARFSMPFTSVGYVNDGVASDDPAPAAGGNRQAVLRFGRSNGTPLVAKVGISTVSGENAALNLDNDIPQESFAFDSIHTGTRRVWEEALSGIVVEGGSKSERINFYTALYHSMTAPNIMSDCNGLYRRQDMEIGDISAEGNHYSTLSLWDTFRALHPLLTLTDEKLVGDIVASAMDMYRHGRRRELPIWPLSAGETGTMTGYHCVSMIADAHTKGMGRAGDDEILEAMVRSSNINRKGSDYYTAHGFIPSDIRKESVSCLLEFAYDDWCIAQTAKAMGRQDIYEEYTGRARNYINVFDGNTMFFRGKRMDGNWETPFNIFAPERAFTEATPWQYRFFVPHDVNGLVQLFGGTESFTAALDSLFVADSRIEGQMSDITGLIGQYAHGNEPSHHMAYLYNYVGQPWKTQAMTRRILDEMYLPTPEGISGNEDCGQMSAWYILSSLGIYQVCPGSNEFNLTTPLFGKAAVRLANGRTLVITADDPRKNTYIDKVSLNGREITANYITYEDIMQGGELHFTLSRFPNTSRGTAEEDFPYSMTGGKMVSMPYTPQDLHLFRDSVTVELACRTAGAEIYYTLDGAEPTKTSMLYSVPFTLTSNCTLTARAFRDGYEPSPVFSVGASRAEFMEPVAAVLRERGVGYSYYEGRVAAVDDIEKTLQVKRGTLPEPSIGGALREDGFLFVFSGIIDIPEDGIYEFSTRSDDGSVLRIGGRKIVDNDGSHSLVAAMGRAALKKGAHRFELRYFEDYAGNVLEWSWKRPGSGGYEPVPAEILFVK